LRSSELSTVHPGGLVITDADGDVRWWTWAGFRANATLAATVSDLVDAAARIDDVSIRLRNDLTPGMWRTATADVADRVCLAEVDDVAVDGLKFSEALPRRLAVATLAARPTDLGAARTVLDEPVRFVRR
jgi:ATP-dependent Lhr-like helicase